MKRFIRKIIIFIGIIVLMSPVFDLLISKELKKLNEYPGEIEVWNDIYNGNIEVDIAVYGSSRAWVHIDPQIIQDSTDLKTYNFGIDGHNFWLQYLRHKEYFKFNQNPKYIILSLDVSSLAWHTELYKSKQFLPYMLWDKNIYKYTKSYKGFEIYDYFIPLVRYRGITNTIIKKTPKAKKKYRNLGFRSMNRTWNQDFNNAKFSHSNYTIKINDSVKNIFKRFILECKTKSIPLIFVYTPEFIDGQNFVKNRNEILEFYSEVSITEGIPFLDYSQHKITEDKSKFYNTTHLNATGSSEFSKILGHDLKEYLKITTSKNR